MALSAANLLLAIFAYMSHFIANAVLIGLGLLTFVIAVLIHGWAMATREMKSAEELGFDRNRDALLYSGSWFGFDRRLSFIGILALLIAVLLGFGVDDSTSGASGLLAFTTFALIGAVARLKRRWPSDDQGTRDGSAA